MLDAGSVLDTGLPGHLLGAGCRVLGAGCWVPGARWTLLVVVYIVVDTLL